MRSAIALIFAGAALVSIIASFAFDMMGDAPASTRFLAWAAWWMASVAAVERTS